MVCLWAVAWKYNLINILNIILHDRFLALQALRGYTISWMFQNISSVSYILQIERRILQFFPQDIFNSFKSSSNDMDEPVKRLFH